MRVLFPRVRQRYADEWNAIELRFSETPAEALRDAERLVGSIMRDRGFPYIDPPGRPEAVAVQAPALAERYREARAVMRRLDDGSRVAVDRMREALVEYRAVVQGMLEEPIGDDAEIERQIDETM